MRKNLCIKKRKQAKWLWEVWWNLHRLEGSDVNGTKLWKIGFLPLCTISQIGDQHKKPREFLRPSSPSIWICQRQIPKPNISKYIQTKISKIVDPHEKHQELGNIFFIKKHLQKTSPVYRHLSCIGEIWNVVVNFAFILAWSLLVIGRKRLLPASKNLLWNFQESYLTFCEDKCCYLHHNTHLTHFRHFEYCHLLLFSQNFPDYTFRTIQIL